jgi:endo-1,4-beta-mannosidase
MDAIIQLANEQDLIICLDIFTLVPNEMGNPIGWLRLKERITQRDKIDFQKRFIKLLSQRYKDTPGITWDLWNEPTLDNSDLALLRNWAKEIITALKDNGDDHLITIGDNLSLELLDILDYASIHTDHPEKFTYINNLAKPFIFQEVWNDSGRSLSDESRQEHKLKTDFNNFLATEASGFVPWQWTNQARLWNNASQSEEWDDELGIFTHDDGTLKLAARAFSLLKNNIREKNFKKE